MTTELIHRVHRVVSPSGQAYEFYSKEAADEWAAFLRSAYSGAVGREVVA